MPSLQVSRRAPTMIITRGVAEHTECEALYVSTSQRLGTYHVTITLQPGTIIGGTFVPSITKAVNLPRTAQKISSFIPLDYNAASLMIEVWYGVGGFDPNERLTRREFVVQTLDIWERMLSQLSDHREEDKQASKEVINAMEALKSTYTISELLDALPTPQGDATVTFEQFKAYFDTANKEDAAHAI